MFPNGIKCIQQVRIATALLIDFMFGERVAFPRYFLFRNIVAWEAHSTLIIPGYR
jgi:hypothetical protein